MKRILLIILTLGVFSTSIFSQDIITKKTGEDIISKVNEITQTEIKYKKFDNLDGPTYSVLKSEVLMIRYQNGTKDIFAENSANSEIKTNNKSKLNMDGFTKAHYFNFPVGTKFISELRSGNTVSKIEVEIIEIIGNEMKIKNTAYVYGMTTQAVTWSKLRYDTNNVSYYCGAPELTFSNGSAEWMPYPINPIVGTTLPEIIIKGKVYSEGLKVPFTNRYLNQKIETKESITTQAGVFDCYLLTYTSSTKMLVVNIKQNIKCWVSDKVGIVKAETFDDKGVLKSTTTLETIVLN